MNGADPSTDRSYRALLSVPWLSRILLAMIVARIAQSMVAIAIVLFTLGEFGSPTLAGVVTLALTLPGLLVSPIAGALLDRHGRMRLVQLDYVVALIALSLIAILSLAGVLEPWLLILIATVSSLTAILSQTGLRSLFPVIVPEHLWERVNAIDSNGYVIATIIGPPFAAGIVALVGGPVALLVTAVAFGIAALAMTGIPDPETDISSSGSILRDALAGGMTTIVVPLLVIERLGLSEAVVGIVFALSGVAGMASALAFGRIDTRGREWPLLVYPMLAVAPAVALLLPPAIIDGLDPAIGVAFLAGWSIVVGIANGPLDIALFTIRQRRTDPAWTGRAFAVSMAMNFVGFPIGAAIAGVLAATSLTWAIVPGIFACLAAVAFAAFLVPRQDGEPGSAA